MKTPRDRHAKIIRARSVAHQIATQQLAKALKDARQIESVITRIDRLRISNSLSTGGIDGASLAAVAELAGRLHFARESTIAPLDDAVRQIRCCQANNADAQRKLDGANRFLEKAERRKAIVDEKRASCRLGFRPPRLGGNPS